jgi:hypothetical protein
MHAEWEEKKQGLELKLWNFAKDVISLGTSGLFKTLAYVKRVSR